MSWMIFNGSGQVLGRVLEELADTEEEAISLFADELFAEKEEVRREE